MTKRDIPMILGGILMIVATIGYTAEGRATEAVVFGSLWLVVLGVYVAVRRRRSDEDRRDVAALVTPT